MDDSQAEPTHEYLCKPATGGNEFAYHAVGDGPDPHAPGPIAGLMIDGQSTGRPRPSSSAASSPNTGDRKRLSDYVESCTIAGELPHDDDSKFCLYGDYKG